MSNIIPMQFEGNSIRFDLDGWMNATDIAKKYGKSPAQLLRQVDTLEYMMKRGNALGINCVTGTQFNRIKELDTSLSTTRSLVLSLGKKTGMVRVKKGGNGGTWLHPKMAVKFARWLSIDAEIWCDIQIENILMSEHPLRIQLDEAIDAVEYQAQKGSRAGRELAQHKYKMPQLNRRLNTLLDRIQGKLALEVVA